MSLRLLLRELSVGLGPLDYALSDPMQLATFCWSIGYEITQAQASQILTQVESETSVLRTAFEQASEGDIDLDRASAVAIGVAGVLDALAGQVSLASGAGVTQDAVYDDIFCLLLRLYLGARLPFVVALLEAVGVITEPNAPVLGGNPVPVGYAKVIFDWSRLTEFLRDTDQWALDVYGWGRTDVAQMSDRSAAMMRIAKLVDMLQIAITRLKPLTTAESLALLGPQATNGALRIDLPFFQADFSDVDPDGRPQFQSELGLSLLPFSDPSDRADSGFAVTPYVIGSATIDQPISDEVRIRVAVDADIEPNARPLLAVTPRGARVLSLDTGGQLVPSPGSHFQVDATLCYRSNSGPMSVAGSESGSRIEAAGTLFSVRCGTPSNLVAAVSVLGLAVVVDLSSDDLLRSILESPVRIPIGDIALGWSSQGGGFIDAELAAGGFAIARSVEVDIDIGPITIRKAELALQLDTPDSGGVSVRASAGIEVGLLIGPVSVVVSSPGGAVSLDLSGDPPGGLLNADFLPPVGGAIAIDADLISGGGMIRYDPAMGRYSGMLELRVKQVGVTAVALLDTRLPGGAPGFALLVVLRATFPPIQIGFGFALTGVGGLLALNRRVDVDALRARFAAGTAGRILAPQDPIRNAPALLADLDAVFPVAPGVTVVGPTVQLVWAELVHFDVGVFIELPGPSRVVLLGSARAVIEGGGRVYLMIRVDIVGVIDLERRLAAFDAVVIDSQLLEVLDLTGGAAFRLSWGAQPYAVLTLGGFHPAYNPEPLVFPAQPDPSRDGARPPQGRALPAVRGLLRDHEQHAAVRRVGGGGDQRRELDHPGHCRLRCADPASNRSTSQFDIRASVRVATRPTAWAA